LNWLNKLPGWRPAAPGLEWTIWKRLPQALAWGTALPALAALLFWWAAPDSGAINSLTTGSEVMDGALWLKLYSLLALVIFVWTAALTVAIGCIVVFIMKGPAYVADPYPPAGRDDAL